VTGTAAVVRVTAPLPPVHGKFTVGYCTVQSRKARTTEKRTNQVATDYDEVRSDVAESRNASLEALRSANAPDARSVARDLDEADTSEGVELPGADLSGEELTVTVIPQKEDEFTCYSCFLVRHRSQLAREKDGHAYCADCLS
jgi:hypothetical protein